MKILRLICLGMLLAALGACASQQSQPGKGRLTRLDTGIVEDAKTGLQWQLDRSPQMFTTQEEAAAYAAALDLGGYHDWRLPSLEERWELLRVFTYKEDGGVEFPHFTSKYWTLDTKKGAQPIKLDISCMCMGVKEVEYKQEGYVRAVRGQAASSR